ncbi:unnamed protein product [Prorocentrum cordatum]|uniref:SAP domain-containing protein n=1 Tax=Prorocentrum cordatum TaxID=2364126 RepID=A0ABN9SI72_9DINO|nr:unnamed protein product [Polarella glacialis]
MAAEPQGSAAGPDEGEVNLEAIINEFVADADKVELELPRSLTAAQRKEAKRLADQNKALKCESYGFGEDRRLHLFKKEARKELKVKNTFIDGWENDGGDGGDAASSRWRVVPSASTSDFDGAEARECQTLNKQQCTGRKPAQGGSQPTPPLVAVDAVFAEGLGPEGGDEIGRLQPGAPEFPAVQQVGPEGKLGAALGQLAIRDSIADRIIRQVICVTKEVRSIDGYPENINIATHISIICDNIFQMWNLCAMKQQMKQDKDYQKKNDGKDKSDSKGKTMSDSNGGKGKGKKSKGHYGDDYDYYDDDWNSSHGSWFATKDMKDVDQEYLHGVSGGHLQIFRHVKPTRDGSAPAEFNATEAPVDASIGAKSSCFTGQNTGANESDIMAQLKDLSHSADPNEENHPTTRLVESHIFMTKSIVLKNAVVAEKAGLHIAREILVCEAAMSQNLMLNFGGSAPANALLGYTPIDFYDVFCLYSGHYLPNENQRTTMDHLDHLVHQQHQPRWHHFNLGLDLLHHMHHQQQLYGNNLYMIHSLHSLDHKMAEDLQVDDESMISDGQFTPEDTAAPIYLILNKEQLYFSWKFIGQGRQEGRVGPHLQSELASAGTLRRQCQARAPGIRVCSVACSGGEQPLEPQTLDEVVDCIRPRGRLAAAEPAEDQHIAKSTWRLARPTPRTRRECPSYTEEVTPETLLSRLISEADSLDTIEAMMEVEERFKIELEDEDVNRTQTIRDLADLVWRTPRGLQKRTVCDEDYIAMIATSHAENRWGELDGDWRAEIPEQYEHFGPSLAEEHGDEEAMAEADVGVAGRWLSARGERILVKGGTVIRPDRESASDGPSTMIQLEPSDGKYNMTFQNVSYRAGLVEGRLLWDDGSAWSRPAPGAWAAAATGGGSEEAASDRRAEAARPTLGEAEARQLRVPELRDRLGALGADASGTKAQLVRRLVELGVGGA